MSENWPSWQTSACPSWCTTEHDEADIEGDRDHTSEVIYLPVIRLLREPRLDGTYLREAEANDLVVAIFQGHEEPHPWLSIGLSEEREYLEMSIESAHRFLNEATTLLASVRL